MTDNKHYYCVILAGGRGRRLWPVSRDEYPKQFIDFFGTGRTLLQQTYDRYAAFIPKENIFVTTYKDYEAIVREQLPELDHDQLLLEPIRRGTAPVVSWACHRIAMRDSDAAFVVSPADQMIQNETQFQNDIYAGLDHVRQHHCLLTMGIRPTRPEPGYGYIQMGEETGNEMYKVKSFTEKPEIEFAEMFMQNGEFLWNTGLFLATVEYARLTFSRLLPDVMRSFDEEDFDICSQLWREENLWVEQHYCRYPNMSLEHGVLERSENVCVKECHFGWADIGGWHGIFDAYAHDRRNNIALSTSLTSENAHGNIVCLKDGRKAFIEGLDNFIVAEQGDVLLIVPRTDSSERVIRMLNRYENE